MACSALYRFDYFGFSVQKESNRERRRVLKHVGEKWRQLGEKCRSVMIRERQ